MGSQEEIKVKNTLNAGLDNPAFITDPDNKLVDKHKNSSSLFSGTLKPNTIWSSQFPGDSENAGKESEGDVPPSDGRDVWDNPVEFLLSCISMSVGLGNVWRFPFIAYDNGGGAFLIPYLIVLLLIGRPMYYMEMCVGQFARSGQVKIWNMAPVFKGVGYGTMLGTALMVSYYCSIMAQTIFFLFSSFQTTLPWTRCDPKWGGDLCTANGSLNPELSLNRSIADWYYKMEAFPQKNDIDDGLGSPEWRLSLCLLLAWTIVFLSLWKGVKSAGKVAYFTAIFPYVVLVILLIRGVTLPGAIDGLRYFFQPKWEELLKPDVWYQAVAQCFFSLGTTFGMVIMLASYNPFRHNVFKDVMIISFMDTITGILAGCTVFSVLGYLAHDLGRNIEDVTQGGPGLAFVSYPEAIASFPIPQLFSVLFFLMLLTLGTGTAVNLTGVVITVITDSFTWISRFWVTVVVCIVGFFCGLLYITPGGNFMVDLVDEFGANFVIYVLAIFEIIGIAWVYGVKNVESDIRFMLNRSVSIYWKFCWAIIIPIGLMAILVYRMVTYKGFTSGGVSVPIAATIFGWLLSAFCLSTVPLFGIHAILKSKGSSLKEKIIESFRPTKDWGPADPKIRKEWMEHRNSYGLKPFS